MSPHGSRVRNGLLRLSVVLAAAVALLVSGVAPAAADTDPNPAGAESPTRWLTADGGNGHWYQLSPRNVDGIQDAMELAAETTWLGQPGYVVSILSEDEKDFLVDTFGSETLYLIGYTDREEEGVWKWVSGEPSGYEFWASGEPNNFRDEDMAVMNWQYVTSPQHPPGAWNDENLFDGPAIFEYEIPVGPVSVDGGGEGLSVTFDEAGFRAKHRIAVTETFDEPTEFATDKRIVQFQGMKFVSVDADPQPGWNVGPVLQSQEPCPDECALGRKSFSEEEAKAAVIFRQGGHVHTFGFRLVPAHFENQFVLRIAEIDGRVSTIRLPWQLADSTYIGLHSAVGIRKVTILQRYDLADDNMPARPGDDGGVTVNFDLDDVSRSTIKFPS